MRLTLSNDGWMGIAPRFAKFCYAASTSGAWKTAKFAAGCSSMLDSAQSGY
jgi:hypothetical protein